MGSAEAAIITVGFAIENQKFMGRIHSFHIKEIIQLFLVIRGTVGVHGMNPIQDACLHCSIHIAFAESWIIKHPLGGSRLNSKFIHQESIGIISRPRRTFCGHILQGKIELPGAYDHTAVPDPIRNLPDLIRISFYHIGFAHHIAGFYGIFVFLYILRTLIGVFHVFLYRIQIFGIGIFQILRIHGVPKIRMHFL